MSRASIAHCIREARRTRGMTQQQLADILNISQQAVDRYEHGLVNIPSERLERLADIFAMQPGDFYACPCLAIVGTPGQKEPLTV